MEAGIRRPRNWLLRSLSGLPIAILWTFVVSILLALVALAIVILIRMKFFSGGPVTSEQFKSLWAFLGVALGAAATLIGALLTATIARETGRREERANSQDQFNKTLDRKRQTLDTVTKVLELITEGSQYAPSARVAGAVATLMELEGGPVAIRMVGELWKLSAIDTSTAVWLIDRVLADPDADENDKVSAAFVLYSNAKKMFPSADDPDQSWNSWPDALTLGWPAGLPSRVKYILVYVIIQSLLSRDRAYWVAGDSPTVLQTLLGALADPDVRSTAAPVVEKLIDVKFLDSVGWNLDAAQENQARTFSTGPYLGWFVHLLARFDSWETNVDQQASLSVPITASSGFAQSVAAGPTVQDAPEVSERSDPRSENTQTAGRRAP